MKITIDQNITRGTEIEMELPTYRARIIPTGNGEFQIIEVIAFKEWDKTKSGPVGVTVIHCSDSNFYTGTYNSLDARHGDMYYCLQGFKEISREQFIAYFTLWVKGFLKMPIA